MMPVGIILSQVFFGIVIFLVSTFLILLVLVQRGRGGGLTGALGDQVAKVLSEPKPGTFSPRLPSLPRLSGFSSAR